MKKTRLLITVMIGIFLFAIAMLAIIKGMADVALMATGALGGLGGGYQISQGYTKTQYIKANSTDKNLEG